MDAGAETPLNVRSGVKEPEKHIRSEDIIGAGVRNRDGEEVGHISELLVDIANGRISYVVLSFGGVLGLGEKLFAIPWEAMTHKPGDLAFVLDVDKERLENASGLRRDEWPLRSGWEHGKSLMPKSMMPYREE